LVGGGGEERDCLSRRTTLRHWEERVAEFEVLKKSEITPFKNPWGKENRACKKVYLEFYRVKFRQGGWKTANRGEMERENGKAHKKQKRSWVSKKPCTQKRLYRMRNQEKKSRMKLKKKKGSKAGSTSRRCRRKLVVSKMHPNDNGTRGKD